jgi:HPt (histidine-containing phosphotransfer) domain-containing protein
MFKRLNQLVIPTQIPHAKRHPAELLVKFIILSGLATLSNVTLFKALNLDLASTISVFAAVAMFSCLLALRFFGMLFATYLLVSIVCLSISASALASGGIQSSFIFWMTVAPLGTSMILGKEHGKVVAGLCTIMFSAVLALSLIYLPDPHIPSYIKSSLSAGVAIGVSILSLIFTSNFQSMKDQAFEALDERNQAIERIINNVSSGFLIIDRQLRILPGYSKSCHALLKQETLEGQCLASLLERDERRKVHLQLIWEQVFDDYMPEEVTLGQSPQRFQISDRHYLALDGKAVREANNQIVGILFTINDVTKLIEAERRNDMNQQLLQILRNREAFSDMIRESREFLDELQKHLGKQSAMSMRILHTMKGNTASFGLTAIAGVIHDIESQDVLKLEDLKAIRLGFDDYLKDNHEIIGISSLESVSDVRYSITASKVMDLKRLFENASSHQEALKDHGRPAATHQSEHGQTCQAADPGRRGQNR